MARNGSPTPMSKQKALSEDELLALRSHLEDWNRTAGRERRQILKAAIAEALLLAPRMESHLKKLRKDVSISQSIPSAIDSLGKTYKQWFYNHGQRKRTPKQTLQSLLLQNLLIGCVHWPAKPGIQDTGRSMQALYRPVMQNLGGLMPHIENDTGPAGGLLHYGRSASYCSGTARPASPYSMYIRGGRLTSSFEVIGQPPYAVCRSGAAV